MQITTSTLQVVLPIQEVLFGDNQERAVTARDLWQALEIGKEFANWIKYQIQSLVLEENVDYIVFAKNGKNPKGGRPAVEYMLTLDTAKHIAMASKTLQGKKVRQYFIEVEKRARQAQSVPQSPMEILENFFKVAKEHDNRIARLEQTKRLEHWQEKRLKDAVDDKVLSLCDGDLSKRKIIYPKVWRLVKDRFNVPRYGEIPAVEFEEALTFVQKIRAIDLLDGVA